MQPQFRANIDGKVGNKTGYIIERQRNNKERIEIDSQLLTGGRQMVKPLRSLKEFAYAI